MLAPQRFIACMERAFGHTLMRWTLNDDDIEKLKGMEACWDDANESTNPFSQILRQIDEFKVVEVEVSSRWSPH